MYYAAIPPEAWVPNCTSSHPPPPPSAAPLPPFTPACPPPPLLRHLHRTLVKFCLGCPSYHGPAWPILGPTHRARGYNPRPATNALALLPSLQSTTRPTSIPPTVALFSLSLAAGLPPSLLPPLTHSTPCCCPLVHPFFHPMLALLPPSSLSPVTVAWLAYLPCLYLVLFGHVMVMSRSVWLPRSGPRGPPCMTLHAVPSITGPASTPSFLLPPLPIAISAPTPTGPLNRGSPTCPPSSTSWTR